METLILPTFPRWCAALRCAWRKHGLLIVPSARLTGSGLCSVEELKWLSGTSESGGDRREQGHSGSSNGSTNGQPRLRDRLCVLIRQYSLDPNLVKAYAADYCGTQTLKEASREVVESFISHLASLAKENRDALVCKLNSYAQPAEAVS